MCGSGSVFGIRIYKADECGSNLDPDPQHCWARVISSYGSRGHFPTFPQPSIFFSYCDWTR